MNNVLAGVLAVSTGLAGYALAEHEHAGRTEFKFITPYNEHEGRPQVTDGTNLACKSIADTTLIEMRINERNAEARAAPGADIVAIKISPDGRGVSTLTAESVRLGTTDAGPPMQIIEKTRSSIIAVRNGWPMHEVLLINPGTGNAVWSRTGFLLGMRSEAMFLQCD